MSQEMTSPRRSWLAENLYLLTGLLIGLGIGLLVAWVISPVQYVDTTPVSLRADFKDGYRALIASAYLATGNLERAQSRLGLLGDPDTIQALITQAQRAQVLGDPGNTAYNLSRLAEAFQQPTSPINPPAPTQTVASPLPVIGSPSATSLVMTPIRTPTRTATPPQPPTPRPTRTPTPTPGMPFELVEQQVVCNPGYPEGLLQIELADAAGTPVPGMRLTVTWLGGSDTFYTGLKPDLGLGIADFEMSPGVTYNLQVGTGGSILGGLSAPNCPDAGGDYWGGIYLFFQQP